MQRQTRMHRQTRSRATTRSAKHHINKKSSPHTLIKRGMAKRKKLFNEVNPDILLGIKPAPEPKFLPNRLPDVNYPATATHLPSQYVGYQFRPRLNEFFVDNLSPKEKRFGDKVDGSGSRFSWIGYQRTKPYVIKAWTRRRGSDISDELRSKGLIPAAVQHITNGENQHINLAIDPVKLERFKTMKAMWSVEWHLTLDNYQEPIRCILRDWQIDPATRRSGSMRFIGTSTMHPTHVHIPMEFEGSTDGKAAKKGAMMLTPSTNIEAIYDPSLASRLGTGAPPIEISNEIHDREPHHTLRAGDVALPQWVRIPEGLKWSKHVLMTFTKNGL